MNLHITIHSTEDGHYRWELRNSPTSALAYAGTAPLLERCFEELLRAQWTLAAHLAGEADTTPSAHAHNASNPAPIAQVQTPTGAVLPVQQDIPSLRHSA